MLIAPVPGHRILVTSTDISVLLFLQNFYHIVAVIMFNPSLKRIHYIGLLKTVHICLV